jgi:hypothetical protein
MSALLLLKLTVVPLFIGGVTLGSRRWGQRAAGLLTSLPVVAGPTLSFYAVEQGNAFAAGAARATLIGLVAVGVFCVAYARVSRRHGWLTSVLTGWLAWGLVTLVIYRLHIGLFASLAVTVACLLLARQCIADSDRPPTSARPRAPIWDLPLRMAVAAALVLALTSAADQLGPELSGVLTPFPVATAIVAGFTHAQLGADAAAVFFRGFLPGLCGFALFCFVLAGLLPSLPWPVALAAALAAQLALQLLLRRAAR